MTNPTIILCDADGTEIKRVRARNAWYTPPQVVLDGADIYLRTSAADAAVEVSFRLLASVEVYKL